MRAGQNALLISAIAAGLWMLAGAGLTLWFLSGAL